MNRTEPARSRHSLIANALAEKIERGEYKVGDLLPSEAELAAAFGVSRHTVRISLQTLNSLGLVTGRQGVGTRVAKRQTVSRYIHSFDSASELLQYATYKRQVVGEDHVVVDESLAQDLGCRVGEHWVLVRTIRFASNDRTPQSYSEIQIPLAFASVVPEMSKSRLPLFVLIEKRFHEAVVEIRQELRAISIPANIAQLLGVKASSAGLEITRRFRGKDSRVLEVARSIHLPESFTYSMNIELRHTA